MLKLNPSLLEGLKLGMVLKIKSLKNNVAHNNILISEEHPIENKELELEYFKENLNFNKRLKVILVLPYQINKMNDSIVGSVFSKNNLTTIATDFHMGAIMAIDSLKSRGLPISVHYFDSENSEQKLQLLASRNQNFNLADLIIDPLFFDNADWLSARVKTPVIAPLYSKKQDAVNRNNLIKTAPSALLNQQKL